MKLYLVGGTVRDHLLGVSTSKDFDFAVEDVSYEDMYRNLVKMGVHVWQERPQYVTLRGKLPRHTMGDFGGLLPAKPRARQLDADFTLCRAEAMYSDCRHPDKVTPADLQTDLSRRDFTMNAVAVDEDGNYTDPFDGARDAKDRRLKCVGYPRNRFEEDPLRVLRALRFAVKYRLNWDLLLHDAMKKEDLVSRVNTLPVERVREELMKAMSADWFATMAYLVHDFPELAQVLERSFPTLWFKATTEER